MIFSKIHGLGNDFIVINELKKETVKDKSDFAKKYCGRHLGIGADGVLFLCASKKADFRMRIFNSDGSEAENCVNGLRCVALQKFLLDKKKKKSYSIETLAGIVKAKIVSFKGKAALVEILFLGKKEFKGKNKITINGREFEYFFVDMGNPHAVVFLKQPVRDFSLEEIGHKFEYHPQFAPARTNTEFVNIISSLEAKMRVHERGACETMACGSGSLAIAIAGTEAGFFEKNRWISIEQPGGKLEINIGKEVLLRGRAEIVFTGELGE